MNFNHLKPALPLLESSLWWNWKFRMRPVHPKDRFMMTQPLPIPSYLCPPAGCFKIGLDPQDSFDRFSAWNACLFSKWCKMKTSLVNYLTRSKLFRVGSVKGISGKGGAYVEVRGMGCAADQTHRLQCWSGRRPMWVWLEVGRAIRN